MHPGESGAPLGVKLEGEFPFTDLHTVHWKETFCK
jgi:hypothetical protein